MLADSAVSVANLVLSPQFVDEDGGDHGEVCKEPFFAGPRVSPCPGHDKTWLERRSRPPAGRFGGGAPRSQYVDHGWGLLPLRTFFRPSVER